MLWIHSLATIVATQAFGTPDVAAPEQDPVLPTQPAWHTLEEYNTDAIGPTRHATKYVYVNFDGGPGNSYIYSGQVEPFPGDDAKRHAVIQSVRDRLSDFDFVVQDRPAGGDYDTEMVGEWASGGEGGAAGVAPGIDCWDSSGGQTSFTMAVNGGADGIGEIILQELAHTWGLAHIDDKTDLLYPTTEGFGKTFKDECLQIVSDTDLNPSSSGCSHHQQACGSSSRQNSYQELMLIFGPSVADATAPTVDITAPADGAGVSETFDLEITLDDNLHPQAFDVIVTLEGLGDSTTTLLNGSHKFPLSGLPEGWLSITVEASDEAGNPASDSIMVEVNGSGDGGGDGGGDDGGTGDDGGGDDGGGDGGGDDGGGDGGGDAGDAGDGGGDGGGFPPPDSGGSGDRGGCGCSTSAPASLGFMLAGLGLLGVPRRRRH